MRNYRVRAAAGLSLLAVVWGGAAGCAGPQQQKENKDSLRFGVLLYREDDTFIGTLKEEMEKQARAYEKENGVKVTLDILDAKGSQNVQANQTDRLISLDCDVLCVNIVDRFASSVVIDKAMAADTPVVFFNREPVEEDLRRWEKLYYVGVDAKETAVLQGQILVDAYEEDPSFLDRNGDGQVSYVLLEGETSHQDSLIRTEWSIETVKKGGVPLKKLTGGIANWERSQASALMEQWLEEYGGQIELAICNNDDMALGALDAMEREGILPGSIKLVGIDGIPAGKKAVEDGKLLGTVECDTGRYAGAIFDIALSLAEAEGAKEPPKDPYYWCPQKTLVRE